MDLYGRHEDRYRDIYSRWNKLVKDIMELLPYIKQLQSQPQHSEDQSKLSHSDTSLTRTTYIITDPVLWERFENNWRARGLDLGFVLKSACKLYHTNLLHVSISHVIPIAKTIRFLACNPNPILQKLTLQRLPPELHHRMMQFEESDIARLLGSTCSYFREISIFYVYEVGLSRFICSSYWQITTEPRSWPSIQGRSGVVWGFDSVNYCGVIE